MMQQTTRYVVSLALCLFLSLITTPSPTTAIVGLDLGQLAGAALVGLALKSAFSIGASLGQASRGRILLNNFKICYNSYLNQFLTLKVVWITINSQFFRKRTFRTLSK